MLLLSASYLFKRLTPYIVLSQVCNLVRVQLASKQVLFNHKPKLAYLVFLVFNFNQAIVRDFHLPILQ